jgi:hypothetical protein
MLNLATIQTTKEYYNLTIDELLTIKPNNYDYTKEENLLFDEGEEIIFFDSEIELQKEEAQLNDYINSKRYDDVKILKTINERLAVILRW